MSPHQGHYQFEAFRGERQMDAELDQAKRTAAFTTPLGEKMLALETFEASEGLSELFEFRVDALSKEATIDFDQILGRVCAVMLNLGQSDQRCFNGVAVEAQATGMRGDLYSYRFLLRPALWLLTRTTNCFIWHDKSAMDIVQEVLRKRDVDFRNAASSNSAKLEYCVQYRETDFNLVSRLMEQHGVYYFFEHTKDGHKMVLADAPSSHQPLPASASINYATKRTGALHFEKRRIYSWSSSRRFRTGKVTLRDYNFKKPNADMTGDAEGSEKYAKAKMEFYDYPGKYGERGDGKDYARFRLEAEQALDHRRFAEGDAADFFPGGLVSLEKYPNDAENKQYLIARCVHRFSMERYRSDAAAAPTDFRPYSGEYELHPKDQQYRALMTTPKPVIYGPQTAKVVARKDRDGEEIDVDDDGYGRIKVCFYWDREDARSCWVRVAQLWAGAKWGWQFIPRIGMEVVVEFLEGDPDRPLIVGAVYNADNGYPYSLPSNKTQSGVKSNSSKGGNGYNELMFEDQKACEKIRLHAEKDLESTILHAETRVIGERFETPVGQSSRTTTLKMGDDELNIQSGSRKTSITMEDNLTVGTNRSAKIGATCSTQIGADQTTQVGGGISVEAGGEITIMAGGAINIEAGATITITAGVSIVLEAGGATFTIGPGVITEEGPMVVAGPMVATGIVVPPAG
jgi:type VI secretion system secreted protein VgrG